MKQHRMAKHVVVLLVRGRWVWTISELMAVQVVIIELHGVALSTILKTSEPGMFLTATSVGQTKVM